MITEWCDLSDFFYIKMLFLVSQIESIALTLCPLVSSTDNLCKQFGARSGPAMCWVWFGSKLFETLVSTVVWINYSPCTQGNRRLIPDASSLSDGTLKPWSHLLTLAVGIHSLFDILIVYFKEFFKKVEFSKKSADHKKRAKRVK